MFLKYHFLEGPPFEWPNENTTGVPAGTVLRNYSDFPGGGPDGLVPANYEAYFPDKIVDGYLIEKGLTIRVPGFTFRNCLFRTFGYWGLEASVDAAGLTVIDCEFEGAGFAGSSVAPVLGQGHFERINGHDCNMGLMLVGGAATIKDCWFHTMGHNAALPHWDGIFIGGVMTNLLIMDNLFHLPNTSGTAAIFTATGPGVNGPIRMIHNRCLGTPSFPIYCTADVVGDLPDVQIINNELQRGDFGYILTINSSPVKDGNVDAFTGEDADFEP